MNNDEGINSSSNIGIPISKVLHSSLLLTEKILFNINNYSKISYIAKMNLMQNMMISKALVSKLLFVFQWWRVTSIAFSQESRNVLLKEKRIRQFYAQLSKIWSDSRLSAFKRKIPDFESVFFVPEREIDIDHITKIDRLAIIFAHNPQRFIRMIGKSTVLVSSPPLYKLCTTLNLKKRHLLFSFLKLSWPKSVPLSNEIVLNLLTFIMIISKRSFLPVDTVDKLLNRVYTIGQYAFLLQELMKYSELLSYSIFSTNSQTAFISFSESFAPFNRFKILFDGIKINLISCIPLYKLPPKINGRYNLKEVFEKRVSMTDEFCQFDREFISFSFKVVDFDILELLIKLKETVYYTHFRQYWYLIRHAIIASSIIKLNAEMICTGRTITQSYVRVYSFDTFKFMFQIDKNDGLLYGRVNKYQFLVKAFLSNGPIKADIFHIEYVLTESLKVLSVAVNFFWLLGFHSVHILPKIFRTKKWAICLSFAPDYLLSLVIHFAQFQFIIISKKSGTVESSKTSASMNFFNFRPGHRETTFKTLMTNKNLIFFLQLQSDLKKQGFLTSRSDNGLRIAMRPIFNVELKVKNNGYWSLRFDKSSYPFFSKNKILIVGQHYTSRISRLIKHLLHDVQRVSSLIFQSSSAQRFPMNVTKVTALHELSALIVAERYHLIIDFSPFIDIMDEGNGQTCYKLYSYIRTTPKFIFISRLSLISNFQSIQDMSAIPSSFGAFLGQKFSVLTHVTEVFRSIGNLNKDWSLSKISENTSFYIVYKQILTMNVSLRHDVTFAIVVPYKGVCSFLLLPLSTLFQIKSNTQLSVSFTTVKSTELSSIKEKVELYYGYLENILKLNINETEMEMEFQGNSFVGKSNELFIRISQNSFSFDFFSIPSTKAASTLFNENIRGISFAVRKLFFSMLVNLSLFDNIDTSRNICDIFVLLLSNSMKFSINWEATIKESKVMLNPQRILICLNEDSYKCWIDSFDGVKFSLQNNNGMLKELYFEVLYNTMKAAVNGNMKLIPALLK